MISKNPSKFFIRKDVTNILTKLTGFDLKKIFKADYNPKLENSDIQLLTESELQKENLKIMEKAKSLLQMPPFLEPRSKDPIILSTDSRLNPLNLTKSNYVFVDISMNLPENKRMIVVRDSDGTLRKANENEREKALQVYFPKEGKSNYSLPLFEPNHLEECLKVKNYLLVLKKACIKFEPNDPEFIRVTHRVYDYVNEVKDYEALHSTRFYGPMVFYLAWYQKLENLIAYMINESKINECVDLIKLYFILHPNESKTEKLMSNETQPEDIKLIESFIKHDLKNSSSAELALLNYLKESKAVSQ